ncbi:MAG: FecR domain-containing protein [Anaerolineae bacterium]|nr:FecR domain-containing protein [Anaerolineae bacterium]
MKSIRRIILTAALLVAVMAAAGPVALANNPAQDTPVLGAVNIIQPELFVLESGAQDEAVIRSPTVFDVGETMRTDATGAVLITWFYDGTETVMGPSTSVTLNTFSGNSQNEFMLDMTLNEGHIVAGIGSVAGDNPSGKMTINTPEYTVRALNGEFEVMVDGNGNTMLIVTDGRVEVAKGDDDPKTVEENHYLTGGPDSGETLSEDGVTINLEGLCMVSASTNMNVRLAPSEDSRRLGGITEGQSLWVRAGTEGQVWLAVYYQTPVTDEEGHNYGWVFGPAMTLSGDACAALIRAPLDSHLYGGKGIDESPPPPTLEETPESPRQ